jgi:hypothetical protein
MEMPRRIRAIVLLAVALGIGGAARAHDGWPVQRHSLWTIEGGRSPVALLGSIHVLRRQHYPLEWPIEQAFDRAQVVVFETDLGGMMSPELRRALSQRGRRAGVLRRQVSRETYRKLGAYLEGFGMPPTLLDHSAPWHAGAVVMVMELERQGYDPLWGVDNYYFRRAEKYGKRTEGLVSLDEHMRMLAELPLPDGDAYLQAMLRDAETLRSMLRDVVRAWKGGEADRLAALVNAGFTEHPGLRDHLLVRRNKQWIPAIERYLAGDEPALVIVGAGHLVGEDSVIELLRRNGHVVEQQ